MEGYALKKWESTLNLCVHAHGPDVELIMEASCSNNYFLDIISFGIGELILCNRGSDHMFFFDPISRASLSISSADQYPSPTFTLIYRQV